MELDQEKQNQEAAERCRALAQRIVRELAPRSVQVLENSGLLEEAFGKMNTTVVQSSPELLVVADPQWVTLPAVQAEKVLLVCAEYAGMADCAKQLAVQGFCRGFAWRDGGKEQLTALFCRTAAPELPDALIQKFRRMKVFFGKLLHTGSSSKRTNVRDFALKKAECSPQIFSSGPASLSGVPTIPYMFYCTVGIRLCQ